MAGLVVPGQASVLTPGVAKDKIFSNPATLPWFCRQELPRVRGILTLSRICCWRDFSLIGRRAATRWRSLRDPLLPDGWPWTAGSLWGLSAPQLSCCNPPALLPGPAGTARPAVPPLLSGSTGDPHQALALCPSKSCVRPGKGFGDFSLKHPPPLLPLHWSGAGMGDPDKSWEWSKRSIPSPQGNPSSRAPPKIPFCPIKPR